MYSLISSKTINRCPSPVLGHHPHLVFIMQYTVYCIPACACTVYSVLFIFYIVLASLHNVILSILWNMSLLPSEALVAVCVGPDSEHPLECSSILYKPPHVNNYTHRSQSPHWLLAWEAINIRTSEFWARTGG